MALGDALAVALLDARGFREEDFARSHPGGALGRKLLMHVRDLMRSGDARAARRRRDASFIELLREMTGKGLGFTADRRRRRPGARHLHRRRPAPPDRARRRPARAARRDVMHRQPRCVRADALAVDAADLMEQHRITSVLVVDADGRLVGALNSNDLMRAKVI